MKLADTIPFSVDLTAPIWKDVTARSGAQPQPDDVVIDESWNIVHQSEEPAVVRGARLLREVLENCFGVIPATDSAARSIALVLDPGLDSAAESHRLRISTAGIEITGASAVGVLRGVFRLLDLMRASGGPFVPAGEQMRRPLFRHRVHRSPLSPFYVEELTGYVGAPFEAKWRELQCEYPAFIEEDAGPEMYYHDNLLLRLFWHGFNGIWIRAALRKFARCSVFPEFGEDSDRILSRLRDLCQRASELGMSVYLYMNEPMGLDEDDPFWDKYPHVRGTLCHLFPVAYLCSSTPEVKAYLRESCRYIFEHVPELAGVLLITASEYPSHCWCHVRMPGNAEELEEMVVGGKLCPRCAQRTPQEVIGEIIGLIRDGIKSVKPEAEVIAWNWSWSMYEPDPQRGVLEALPDDVIVMGDYERSTPTKALDFEYVNEEYSIKVIGPSPRFVGCAEFQRGRGLPIYAKVQIGTTHENPNVPYLPTLQKIARKWQTLVEAGVTGMMTCWNFGNMPSLGTEVAGEMSWDPQPSVQQAVRQVAVRHFGPAAADAMVAGWEQLCRAQDDFPGSIPVMYYGPMSRAPVLPWLIEPVDRKFPRSWLLDTDIRGDKLDWVSPFGAEKVLECFRAVAAQWAEGLRMMEPALACAQGPDRERLEREIGVVRFCLVQLVSSANITEFLLTRDALHATEDRAQRQALLDRIEQLCHEELDNAAQAIALVEADCRLGWHGEAYGPMITRELVEAKLAGLQEILQVHIPRLRGA